MAKITLSNLQHSYLPNPKQESDYALKELNISWQDAGAYALLGPSGCGKTTLLNIISGLLHPSEGKVLFNDEDVTYKPPAERNIAQVFQFPVIYDTMTVYNNLAFPLKNRRMNKAEIEKRVKEIATMLELEAFLNKKAQGLTPDVRQKISMGRGLVRGDVNVMMFDEPLTVIDPLLKWTLRSKLKELHQKVNTTMIYVTHDQTEALTFADQVVVMNEGEVMQIGSPVELYENPNHLFVGHFIGSPGMNIAPCRLSNGGVIFEGLEDELLMPDEFSKLKAKLKSDSQLSLGIRPEFLSLHKKQVDMSLPAEVTKIIDSGQHQLVDVLIGKHKFKSIIEIGNPVEKGEMFAGFDSKFTHLYQDGWLMRIDQ